jgi:hypothetical protein
VSAGVDGGRDQGSILGRLLFVIYRKADMASRGRDLLHYSQSFVGL